MNRTEYIYVGIYIHKETHTAVLVNYLEESLGEISVDNNVSDFRKMFAYVEKVKGNLVPIYGLEDVTHYGRSLAIYLLDKKQKVKEVNSALSFMERMSYASTKKNDTWDAKCIAAVLMRRYEDLLDANPQDYYWTMRHLVNRRNALVKASTKLMQQFHDQIQNVYPSYKKFFHAMECPTALAFFERFPSPSHLDGMDIKELGAFLRIPSHNTYSDKRAELILELVEQDVMKDRDYQYARDEVVRGIVRQIGFYQEEIRELEKIQKELLKELEYQLETISGVNVTTACALVGYIGDIHCFSSADKLANYSGVAPMCFSSVGKGKIVQNKTQGNRELYAVLYFLAIQQIYKTNKGEARNPVLLAYYERKISEGKTKVQSLICIMRKLVVIIYSMMKKKTAYILPQINKKMVS